MKVNCNKYYGENKMRKVSINYSRYIHNFLKLIKKLPTDFSDILIGWYTKMQSYTFEKSIRT